MQKIYHRFTFQDSQLLKRKETVDLWIQLKHILIQQPITPADKGRVILAMGIVNMDPLIIANLKRKRKSSSTNI